MHATESAKLRYQEFLSRQKDEKAEAAARRLQQIRLASAADSPSIVLELESAEPSSPPAILPRAGEMSPPTPGPSLGPSQSLPIRSPSRPGTPTSPGARARSPDRLQSSPSHSPSGLHAPAALALGGSSPLSVLPGGSDAFEA